MRETLYTLCMPLSPIVVWAREGVSGMRNRDFWGFQSARLFHVPGLMTLGQWALGGMAAAAIAALLVDGGLLTPDALVIDALTACFATVLRATMVRALAHARGGAVRHALIVALTLAHTGRNKVRAVPAVHARRGHRGCAERHG